MIESFSVSGYRSLRDIVVPLSQLNIVTGPNGSGKSNLYKALRLLSEATSGNMIQALSNEGGLESVFWAGPESFSKGMKNGTVPVQGGPRNKAVRLSLGFSSAELGYAICFGLPEPSRSKFSLDPEIKRECIWAGPFYRPASCLVDRKGPVVKIKSGRKWTIYQHQLSLFDSILSEIADPEAAPEIFSVRKTMRSWRFYDQFRTDRTSRIRIPQIGTRTPVLDHDGNALVAALQTIVEIGDRSALDEAIGDAFPGASISIDVEAGTRFKLVFKQPGLLRPLNQSELSDGTLRYLLLVAALLTPRPPELMVLNEPETSLHPDLLPALARLINKIGQDTQIWVVSHAARLVAALEQYVDCHSVQLDKQLSETVIKEQGMLDKPAWYWPN